MYVFLYLNYSELNYIIKVKYDYSKIKIMILITIMIMSIEGS